MLQKLKDSAKKLSETKVDLIPMVLVSGSLIVMTAIVFNRPKIVVILKTLE